MGNAKRIGRDLKLVTADELLKQQPVVPAWYSRWPNVYKYVLNVATTHAGKPLPSLTIFAQGGRVRICFCDRVLWRSVFRTGDSFEECMARLNEAFATSDVDWRKSVQKRSSRGNDVSD